MLAPWYVDDWIREMLRVPVVALAVTVACTAVVLFASNRLGPRLLLSTVVLSAAITHRWIDEYELDR
jgi:hypothetical protein